VVERETTTFPDGSESTREKLAHPDGRLGLAALARMDKVRWGTGAAVSRVQVDGSVEVHGLAGLAARIAAVSAEQSIGAASQMPELEPLDVEAYESNDEKELGIPPSPFAAIERSEG
jgi:hypothetical protein